MRNDSLYLAGARRPKLRPIRAVRGSGEPVLLGICLLLSSNSLLVPRVMDASLVSKALLRCVEMGVIR